MTWVQGPSSIADFDTVLAQCSAHGVPQPATVTVCADGESVDVRWIERQRRIAPGQSVVLYDPTDRFVLGGGVAASDL